MTTLIQKHCPREVYDEFQQRWLAACCWSWPRGRDGVDRPHEVHDVRGRAGRSVCCPRRIQLTDELDALSVRVRPPTVLGVVEVAIALLIAVRTRPRPGFPCFELSEDKHLAWSPLEGRVSADVHPMLLPGRDVARPAAGS